MAQPATHCVTTYGVPAHIESVTPHPHRSSDYPLRIPSMRQDLAHLRREICSIFCDSCDFRLAWRNQLILGDQSTDMSQSISRIVMVGDETRNSPWNHHSAPCPSWPGVQRGGLSAISEAWPNFEVRLLRVTKYIH